MGVPVHADVGHRKNLLLPQLAAVGDPDERDARRHVAALLLRLVGGDDGVRPGGPLEVDDAVELERFFVEQAHRRQLVHGHDAPPEARHVLVVAAAGPLEERPAGAAALLRLAA